MEQLSPAAAAPGTSPRGPYPHSLLCCRWKTSPHILNQYTLSQYSLPPSGCLLDLGAEVRLRDVASFGEHPQRGLGMVSTNSDALATPPGSFCLSMFLSICAMCAELPGPSRLWEVVVVPICCPKKGPICSLADLLALSSNSDQLEELRQSSNGPVPAGHAQDHQPLYLVTLQFCSWTRTLIYCNYI